MFHHGVHAVTTPRYIATDAGSRYGTRTQKLAWLARPYGQKELTARGETEKERSAAGGLPWYGAVTVPAECQLSLSRQLTSVRRARGLTLVTAGRRIGV